MGQEVDSFHFHKHDFSMFNHKLRSETDLLRRYFTRDGISDRAAIAGFELELSLIDEQALPAAKNSSFLEACRAADVSAELALFNLEMNTTPQPFHGHALTSIHKQLQQRLALCSDHARTQGLRLLLTGILPTLTLKQLRMENMSPLKRYQALNEQVLRLRHGKALHIDIDGQQHLIANHDSVMIEAATTSFQMHWQVNPATAHRYYNAMLIASAPLVAAAANSPLLFGKVLWQETRIPLFEQALAVHDGTAGNRLPRVTLGTGYAMQSLLECFEENINEYAVILPAVMGGEASQLRHLQLHNGTIWRWVRPIIGFDSDGTPHLRLEQRTTAAGPTLVDNMANAALLFGLSYILAESEIRPEAQLEFAQIRTNFYNAARLGLQGSIDWLDGKSYALPDLFKQQLLPMATEGLKSLQSTDFEPYLSIIGERVATGRNGAWWQLEHFRQHQNLTRLTNDYYHNQQSDRPVHEWRI